MVPVTARATRSPSRSRSPLLTVADPLSWSTGKLIFLASKDDLCSVMDDLPLDRALTALGELLAADGETVRLVAVGGAALRLRGLVERTTTDVDVIARVDEAGGAVMPPDPLPAPVVRAAAAVARDLGLAADWLNTEIAAQWRTGLPPGLGDDLAWRQFGGPPGGLTLGLVGRRTLLALKLFAAVDRGPRSVHFQDLRALAPTRAELSEAAAWVRTQDQNPVFGDLVDQVVERALDADG